MANLKEVYSMTPKKIRIFILALVAVLAVVFIGAFLFVKSSGVPSEFKNARFDASETAKQIVILSNESAQKIGEISSLNTESNLENATNLIVEEIKRNQEVRQKAILLSSDLETMTKNIAQITPESSARIALEAIAAEATLINRLISYNDYLYQILEILRAKITGQEGANSQAKINDLIKKANDEAKLINETNNKFNELMQKFDSNKDTDS